MSDLFFVEPPTSSFFVECLTSWSQSSRKTPVFDEKFVTQKRSLNEGLLYVECLNDLRVPYIIKYSFFR
jgi:hypothetical protein